MLVDYGFDKVSDFTDADADDVGKMAETVEMNNGHQMRLLRAIKAARAQAGGGAPPAARAAPQVTPVNPQTAAALNAALEVKLTKVNTKIGAAWRGHGRWPRHCTLGGRGTPRGCCHDERRCSIFVGFF